MPNNYRWSPITDLGDDPKALTDGELESLQHVWKSQKTELIGQEALEEFEKRLRREWSIETGIIERVYTLDRGIAQTLIQKGIDAALIPHGASDRDSTPGTLNSMGPMAGHGYEQGPKESLAETTALALGIDIR